MTVASVIEKTPPAASGKSSFAINFAPRKSFSPKTRATLASFAVGYLVVQGVLFIGLIGVAALAGVQGAAVQGKLSRQEAGAAVSSAALEKEARDVYDHARKNLVAINKLIAAKRQRFPVGAKIGAVVKTLPPRTWIASVTTQQKERVLRVEAVYLVDPAAPQALPIKEWEKTLKSNRIFSKELRKLSIGKTSSTKQGPAECVNFEMVAEW